MTRAFRNGSGITGRAGFQRHHLIPVEIFRNRHFSARFDALATMGFDPRDFSGNGFLLPATEDAAMESALPLHRGPHPLYNQLVAERVGSILKPLGRGVHRKSACRDAADRMRWLQSGLRRALSRPPTFVPLNRRDPMSCKVCFSELENEIDRIWSLVAQD